MLCACSGEQFKFEEPVPQSPESLATRDFSASGLSSSRVGDWESKFEDAQVDEAESTLKEALSLNYEEARALLGRLEFQKGNFDAALQVFQGIDIRSLTPRMTKAITQRTRQQKSRYRGENALTGVMSLHSVSLLLEAILLKSKSLKELGRFKDAARECKILLDTVETALPNGMPQGIVGDCKLQEMFHKAMELLPKLWIRAGFLQDAVAAYRRALVKPWDLSPQRLASVEKDLASALLYGGVETNLPPHLLVWGQSNPNSNIEEAILLLFILMKKMVSGVIQWDSEIVDHLTFSLSVSGQCETLADHVERILPGTYTRAERWYFLALCYCSAGQEEAALNLLKKIFACSKSKDNPNFHALLLGAKLCSRDPLHAHEGIKFARKMIDLANDQNKHFLGQAHKFLGVCFGNAARVSISDSERVSFHREAMNSLNYAAVIAKEDPEIMFSLGLENLMQRNLVAAFDSAMLYSGKMAGSSGRGWKLLALIVSAEQRFKDSETIVELALDETANIDQLELLRLKAILQIAQQQPKQAIETYKFLLAVVQAQREQHPTKNSYSEVQSERRLELEAWQDLAKIYSNLESWPDAEICIEKAKTIELFCPRGWHTTGLLFEARELYEEALVALSISLSSEPNYVPSIISTADVLMKMGRRSLPIAKSFLMSALRLEPTNHEAWLKLGKLCKTEGSMQQAADFFQAAHELKASAPIRSFV